MTWKDFLIGIVGFIGAILFITPMATIEKAFKEVSRKRK
jgi:hypothetical protein